MMRYFPGIRPLLAGVSFYFVMYALGQAMAYKPFVMR